MASRIHFDENSDLTKEYLSIIKTYTVNDKQLTIERRQHSIDRIAIFITDLNYDIRTIPKEDQLAQEKEICILFYIGYYCNMMYYTLKIKHLKTFVLKWFSLITETSPCAYVQIHWALLQNPDFKFRAHEVADISHRKFRFLYLPENVNQSKMETHFGEYSAYRNTRGSLCSTRFLENFEEFKTHFCEICDSEDFISSGNYEFQISEDGEAKNAIEVCNILWFYKANCHKIPNPILTIFSYYDRRLIGNLWDLVTWGLAGQTFSWSDFLTKGLYDPRLLLWIFAYGSNAIGSNVNRSK